MVAAGVAAGVVRGVLSARRKNNTQADSATHLEPSAVGTTETSDSPRNQALVAGTAFGGKKSRRQVISGNHLIKKLKQTEQQLTDIQRLSNRRQRLRQACCFLALLGLALTAMTAEVCRYGYVPTEDEVRSGYLNPYFSDTHMCSGTPEREGNLWTCQAFVSFTTFLLGVAVCVAEFTALQEKEKQIVFMASHSDPPDMEIISHSAKQARKQNAVKWTILVLFLAVLPHPMPGYKRTIYVQSLERNAQYEFEALIVLWMYGRFWHLWAMLKQSEFRRNFEDLSYELGERSSILDMMGHWDDLNDGLAMKMMFKDYPVQMLTVSTILLLVMCAYSVRLVETPVNKYHGENYWHDMWLMIVTMTTVGYGDSVPQTHFGRFVCVIVMIVGTILVSLMTAVATEFLMLNPAQQIICQNSDWNRRRRNVIMAIVDYLQYIYRVEVAELDL